MALSLRGRVDRLSLVGHVGNEPVDGVGAVGGGLDPSVGESDHKLTLHISLKKVEYK